MLNFTENFFKKHKAWLDRNREFLESSNWSTKPPIVTVEVDETGDKKKPSLYTSNKNLIDRKEAAISSEKAIVKNIVGRLAHFIKNTPGEKHLKRNKEIVKYMLDIISIFTYNCEMYLEENPVTTKTITNSKVRNLEIKFQDLVFNEKIGIEDRLEAMGAFAEHEDVKIKFYRDDKASLVLREPLVLLNEDVKLITSSVDIKWETSVSTSKEMYINMNPKDIPPWNHRKHFFEQEPATIQFWTEELSKIKNGVTIGGYFIHPWLYFHLNFFKTPIPQPDGSEPTIQPGLRDNEWFFAENLKSCINTENEKYYSKAMLVYGTRRFAKSVILASLAHWRTLTKFNSYGTIVGGDSSDLGSLTSKVKTSMTYIEKAFKLDMMVQNWDNGDTTFGIKQDVSNAIVFSTLIVQNLQAGAKTKTQKTAGLAPSVSIYDEIGKYPFLKGYLAALPSFKTPYGFKCVTVLAGTGGEADLSVDAMHVLNNPEAYDLLPMNWDLLESKIDPEYITWKRRKFATFFPGQMAYEAGFIKENKPFGDFLGKKNEDLNKIDIDVTNWKQNQILLDNTIAEAKAVKGSKGKLLAQQKKVQYPQDPEDCFITLEGNPFPSEEAKLHKQHLLETGDLGRKVLLTKQADGSITADDADHLPLAEFPHPGGFIDAPVVLYEPLPTSPPPFGLYVAGFDDYKHDVSDGDSVGSMTIYKRQWFDPWSLRIVASYHARPNPRSKFDRQCYYLLKAYNAVCFPENEDNNFKAYLDNKHETEIYFAKGMDFASELSLNNNGNRVYGWAATTKNIEFGYGLIARYLNEEQKVVDENGDTFEVLGVKRIPDIGMLEEIQNYTKEGNFDRLRSFMGALMYSHYLDKIFVYPKPPTKENTKKREEAKKKVRKRVNPYRKARGSAYRK